MTETPWSLTSHKFFIVEYNCHPNACHSNHSLLCNEYVDSYLMMNFYWTSFNFVVEVARLFQSKRCQWILLSFPSLRLAPNVKVIEVSHDKNVSKVAKVVQCEETCRSCDLTWEHILSIHLGLDYISKFCMMDFFHKGMRKWEARGKRDDNGSKW